MNNTTMTIAVLLTFCQLSAAQINYNIPYPRPIGDADDTLSFYIIGDVMMHSPQLKYDCSKFFETLEPDMRAADVMVANMEFTLAGPPYTGYPCFSAPDGYARYMVEECGADVLLTANNHILDKGSGALCRTLDVYSELHEEYGARFTGSARDAEEMDRNFPLMIEKNGFRIALINFTYGTNLGGRKPWPKVCRMEKDGIAQAFDSARLQGADFIIALPHWGDEYKLNHNSTQEEWAEWLVGQGADAIVGAHPHVVQDTTHICGRPVIYSIGNAVSNMSAENTRLELAVSIKFVCDSRTGKKRMLEPQLHFLWCTRPGTLTEGYTTIYAEEWANRRGDWLTPSDFDNMTETLKRVKDATGIGR